MGIPVLQHFSPVLNKLTHLPDWIRWILVVPFAWVVDDLATFCIKLIFSPIINANISTTVIYCFKAVETLVMSLICPFLSIIMGSFLAPRKNFVIAIILSVFTVVPSLALFFFILKKLPVSVNTIWVIALSISTSCLAAVLACKVIKDKSSFQNMQNLYKTSNFSKMTICQLCSKMIKDSAKFCAYCGSCLASNQEA